MKLKEFIEAYSAPEFETLEIQDRKYRAFYKCFGMNDVEKDRPDLLDYDIIKFCAYPGGIESNSVKFVVRIDM